MSDQIERVAKAILDAGFEVPAHDIARLSIKTLFGSIAELVGVVMKNSGGSANPETVEKVIRALNGERVSFVGTPSDPQRQLTDRKGNALRVVSAHTDHWGWGQGMPAEGAAYLRSTFGYVPDERGGERWTIYQDHTLIVIHPERRPRLYKRGCGGTYYEIDPIP